MWRKTSREWAGIPLIGFPDWKLTIGGNWKIMPALKSDIEAVCGFMPRIEHPYPL